MALRSNPSQLIRELESAVERGPQEVGPGFLRVIQGGLSYAAEDAAASEGAGSLEIAGVIGAGLAAILSWPVVLIVVGVALVFYMFHRFMRDRMQHIPIVGGGIASALDYAFGWVDIILNWAGHELTVLGGEAVHGFERAVQMTVTHMTGIYPSAIDAKIENYVRPVQSDLAHLHVDFNHLWDWVNQIAHVVGHEAAIAVNPTGDLASQIHDLQRSVHALQNQQLIQSGQLTAIYGQVASIQAEWAELVSHIVGVRAVSVGVQDMWTAIENLTTEVHNLQTAIAPQVATHTGQINTLYPLGILLAAGAVGLENLRKLEDNPCQCPRLPGVINELGLAMSVLHHVKGD